MSRDDPTFAEAFAAASAETERLCNELDIQTPITSRSGSMPTGTARSAIWPAELSKHMKG